MTTRGGMAAALALALPGLVAWLALSDDRGAIRRDSGRALLPGPPQPSQSTTRRRTLEDRSRDLEEEDDGQARLANRVALVRTESGEPIANAAVLLGTVSHVTDSDGCAAFKWPEGERKVAIGVRHPAFVDLVEERSDTGGEFAFTLRRGHTIRGYVRFLDGSPAPEVRVRASSVECTDRPHCFTDALGNFELTGIPDVPLAAFTVEADTATTPTGKDETYRWSPGDPPLVFTVRDPHILLRTVGADGQPVRETSVRVLLLADGRRTFQGRHAVEPRNVFRKLHDRRFATKFIVVARGYRAVELTVPPAWSAAGLFERRIELEPFVALPVDVRVLRAEGDLAGDVSVALLDEEGDTVRQFLSTQSLDVPVRVDGVAPGAIRARIWESSQPLLFREETFDAAAQTVEVTLPAGSRVQFPLPTGIDVTYTIQLVRIADGLPVGLRMVPTAGIFESASLVPAGRYRL